MQIIERKLQERHDMARAARPDDRIVNPLAVDPKGHIPLYRNVAEKRAAYNLALDRHEFAYIDSQNYVRLGTHGAEFNDVEYIAGLWRVQTKLGCDVIQIQDKEFVLLDRLNRKEHTDFEFYNAASVTWWAYGQTCGLTPDYIIAKYETNRGTFYAYGCRLTDQNALSKARAHLAGKLFEAYQDIIALDAGRQK